MTILKDENGNEMIGYIELNGMAIPRAYLVKVLPDIERFERCLDDALRVSRQMDENEGRVPDCMKSWTGPYVRDIAATVGELGEIYASAAELCRADAAARQQPGEGHA